MNKEVDPQELEELETGEPLVLPIRPRDLRRSIRVTIRGRSVRLAGIRHIPPGLLGWLLILGPGLIATSAGNDAGGIATYSSAGAKYGYDLIWVMVIITVSLAVVQEMCARLGAATGRGLLDLIRERFGAGWALFAIAVILIANGGVTISEFVGIGAAMELIGVSKNLAIPLTAGFLWYLVVYGNYPSVEKIFLAMTVVFFAYPIAAFMGHPDWVQVAHGAFIPKIRWESDYIFYRRWFNGHDDHALHAALSAEFFGRERSGPSSLWARARRCLFWERLFQPDVDLHDHRDRRDALCSGPARD